MKIINGENLALGRLASIAAKYALNGEDVVILNCKNVIISGNKKNIQKEFQENRKKGSKGSLKGPKIPRVSYKIVKRAIRGMLPNHRSGRGKIAYKKIKCYNDIPEEFKNKKSEEIKQNKKIKYIQVKNLKKWIKIKIQ